ncbi:MAG TPA: hypothetical protein VHT24_13455 [Pseudacidobacterium sp.]|jgi:hypothetical protein|nr:hypothetical protein [Pseudacidobacterium sp.]
MKRGFLLTVAVLFGFNAFGQDTPPRFEVPVGFSFINAHPDLSPINSFNVYGGGGQFNVNFGQYFGIKADLMGYANSSNLSSRLQALGFTGNVSGNLFTYMFGPQIKRHTGVIQPFAEALVGGAHSNVYTSIYDATHGITNASGSSNAFAFAAGGGLDFRLSRLITIRPVEADYLLTRFSANGTTGNQNNFRYFAGINFTFGGAPPIPPTATCSVQPTEVMAGDPITATISIQNFRPNRAITFSWSSTGGRVLGTGATVNLNTTGLAPGSYTVTGTATDPRQRTNNTASCNASFTVKMPRPPVASCSADPSSVQPGGTSTITVTASSPDGRPLTFSYAASAGSISGTGNTATLNTAGAAAGTITVTANVMDDHGQSTPCTAMVNVQAPPLPAAEAQQVGTCNFSDPRRRTRVDNECKAVLDEAALRLQHEPTGRLVVVGSAEEEELTRVSNIDAQRAENIKYYLTSGEGQAQIDPSRIEARTGPHGSRSASLYFVPEGASFSGEGTQPVDESRVKGQSRRGGRAARRGRRAAAAAETASPSPQ